MNKLTQVKFSKEASDALNKLKGRIGMNWNVLCRIGFCMSLNDPEPLTTETYKPDAAGIIIDRKILIGNEDSLYIALLKEWCIQREHSDEKIQTEYFKAHMNRGIILLSKRIANFKDVFTTTIGHSCMSHKQIYLDHNATTPVDPHVLKVMLPYFTEEFGNAASVDHEFGSRAKTAVDKAREQIAKAINAFPDEIIFTSGATESDNIALFGVAERYAAKGKHIITCVTEHKAILDCCKQLEKQGFRITYLGVDEYGTVNLQELEEAITPETILVSIMAANNEIGTLAPLTEIGDITRRYGVLFHTDAAQALGLVSLDVQASNIDILSMSAHKVYGPKGVGALYRRRSNPRVNLTPVIFGGGHEKGLRSGTLNVPGIVGFGKAVELALKEADSAIRRYREWAQQVLISLQQQGLEISLNGHPERRLPNNINVSIKGLESRALIVQLKDVAISTGSACTTTSVEPSHVILALGFGEERAHSAIRIGFGRFNTNEEITEATKNIVASVNKLKAFSA